VEYAEAEIDEVIETFANYLGSKYVEVLWCDLGKNAADLKRELVRCVAGIFKSESN